MKKSLNGLALLSILLFASTAVSVQSLPIDPDYKNALKLLDAGKNTEAITCLNKSISRFPKGAELYTARAEAYRRTGKVAKSVSDWTKAIELDPKNHNSYHNRGVTYLNSNDPGLYVKAKADFDKAIALKPSFAAAYSSRARLYGRLNQWKKGHADCSKAIELNPSTAVDAYAIRGTINMMESKYGEAILDVDRAIGLEPSAALYNNRAWCNVLSKKPKQALKDVSMALQFLGKSKEDQKLLENAYCCRAIAHAKLGEIEASMSDCAAAIQTLPATPALLTRSSLYLRKGMGKEALADANEALKLIPDASDEGYYLRSQAYLLLNQKEKAQADLKKAKELGYREDLYEFAGSRIK